MTKTAHTPGPWRVECDPCHYDSATDVVDANGGMIACTGGRNVFVMEANARLIAAAPELLEAARAARNLIFGYLGNGSTALVQLDAAIAKAEAS